MVNQRSRRATIDRPAMTATVYRSTANQLLTRLGPIRDAVSLRIVDLARRFGLSPLEVDVVSCLLAAEYDAAIGRREWIDRGTIAQLLQMPAEHLAENLA